MHLARKLMATSIASVLMSPTCLSAATITVDSIADDPGPIGPDECRLRSAVVAANSDSPQQGCEAGNGDDSIIFDGLASATIILEQGEIVVSSGVSVDGDTSGNNITISGNDESRILNITGDETPSVSLSNLTLTAGSAAGDFGGAIRLNGLLDVSDSTISQSAAEAGGAIFVSYQSTATLSDSTISNNRASGDSGGAIFSLGELHIGSTTLTENEAYGDGGAIFASSFLAYPASAEIIDSTFLFNTAGTGGGGNGGAIASDGVPVTITGTRFSNNAGEAVGGINFADKPAPLSIRDTTMTDTTGGVIASYDQTTIADSTISGNRGGRQTIRTRYDLTLINTTLSDNVATRGTLNAYQLDIRNSTLLDNAPVALYFTPDLELRNTVVAGSETADCNDSEIDVFLDINNFIGDGTCPGVDSNRQQGDPMLGPLQDNGGTTMTHTPLPGSPLTDGGDSGSCADFDQTGTPRPIDGNGDALADCDIGAVEFIDVFPPTATLAPIPDILMAGGTSLDVSITFFEADSEVDPASIGASNIQVTPGPLAIQNVSVSGSPSEAEVIYRVVPPGGRWDGNDSGEYTVTLIAEEVLDTATTGPNPAAGEVLGTFEVVLPEIDVTGSGLSIMNGDTSPRAADGTDFGEVELGTDAVASFTIANIGKGTLNLLDAVQVVGDGFATNQPSTDVLSPEQVTTFTVTLSPTSSGATAGIVSIRSDDGDENPYTFAVRGVGVDAPSNDDVIFANGFD